MHRRLAFPCLALVLALYAAGTAAKDPPTLTPQQQAEMEAYQKAGAPGPAHAALAKTVGRYTLAIKSWPAPGADAVVESGTATRQMTLDGRVLVEDSQATMMGQPFTGHGMHGFDNVTGKYWSTWNDSMSTGLMVSEGSCDAAGACTYSGSWNDPVSKAKSTAHMKTHWPSPTTQVFEMYGPAADGKEFKMMEITYTRMDK
jgi:hypothetical protein